MERKKLISRIDRAHTTPEQQAAIDHHIEQGYRNHKYEGKRFSHSVVSFTSLEEGSYAVDKALKEKIGKPGKDPLWLCDFFRKRMPESAETISNGCWRISWESRTLITLSLPMRRLELLGLCSSPG